MNYTPFKRAMDILGATLGLVILSPLILFVAILIRLSMGKPVLFRQVRPGTNEKPFIIYKFRTMNDNRAPDGSLLSDKERLIRLGVFLRKSSIDELPELWNVLKGDMSLVGPRPLLMQYLPLYNEFQRKRMNIKPGITGWAQVNGRNAILWEQKFEMDVWYVDHQSFLLDIKILWLTFIKIIRRESINAPGEATMSLFMGTEKEN